MESKLKRKAVVANELGLHARVAAKIAKITAKAKADVWLAKDGQMVDATSVIDILSLVCVQGTEVEFSIEDETDITVLEEVARFIQKDNGEVS